ncbi:MAG: site-specific integrase [Bryobacterales bacterium]|jgi:integrase|nr:site-specific integrase [Bryobacterales bacterium]
MVLVAQYLGLRVSEIVGWNWKDFDFEAGTVLVQRAWSTVESIRSKRSISQDHMPLDSSLGH